MLRARQARRARGNGGTGSAGSGADLDLFFSNSTYTVSGGNYTTLGSIPGFTFTRASLAMGYDATGKLTYGPNNLILQSQTFGTTWTATQVTVGSNVIAAPDGTMTADSLIATAVSSQHRADQTPSSPAGPQVFSVYAKAGAYNYVGLRIGTVGAGFDLTTGATSSVTGGITATATSVGNGWWRCAIHYATAAANDICRANIADGSSFAPTFTGDGVSAGIYIWGAQLEAVTYQTTPSTYYPTTTAAYYGPRLVYDPVTLASQGILVEEARTNLCLQSQTFDNASWSKNGSSPVSVTSNSAIAPDGTLTADTLTGDNANADRVQQTITTTASAPYNFSVFLKNVNATASALTTTATSPLQITVTWTGADITAITQTNGTGTYRSVGNGWWRVDGQFTLGASDTAVVFRIYPSYAGSGAKSVYAWQAQVEAGTGASSPIPTTTASVTRAADDAVMTGLSLPGPCSFATDALAPAFVSTDARHTLSDGNTNNRLWLSYNGSILNVNAMVANTGVSPVSSPAVAPGVAFKAAQSSNNGTYLSVVNGGTVETASGGVMPTLTRLDIGKNAGSSLRYWNNTISRIRIYNRALSDAELQAITQSLLLQEDGYSILQEDNSYIWLE